MWPLCCCLPRRFPRRRIISATWDLHLPVDAAGDWAAGCGHEQGPDACKRLSSCSWTHDIEVGAPLCLYMMRNYLVDCCLCVQVLDVSIPQYSSIWQDGYYIQGAATACFVPTVDRLQS